MARSKHRKSKSFLEKLPLPEREIYEAEVWAFGVRLRNHLSRNGEDGPDPMSESWIEISPGTPLRAYLDEYCQTWLPPDVRSASDPVTATALWDYLEAHEAEGTLPLCVPSLVRGASKSNLPREVLDSLRAQGLTRHDICYAQTRYVRPSAEEDDGSGNLCFVDEFVLHPEVIALRAPDHVCACTNCAHV
jgi:hypothetical protein